jgi:predicted small lipoprotein YifL
MITEMICTSASNFAMKVAPTGAGEEKRMSKSLVKFARITLVLSLAGAVVVGCGRKGDLDRPGTPLEQQNVRKSTKAADKKEVVPDRPFILDKLL